MNTPASVKYGKLFSIFLSSQLPPSDNNTNTAIIWKANALYLAYLPSDCLLPC